MPEAFNYRDMLKAYISHIRDCEGIDFIESYYPSKTALETKLTDAEREELKRISYEAWDWR